MKQKISNRLLEIVNALPLKSGMRIIEIGCGTGVAAREIATRIGKGKVLGIDRSKTAIDLAIKSSEKEISNGTLQFVQASIETFELPGPEELYDLAFAIRVGALDGRKPGLEQKALAQIAKALSKDGQLFIDGGNPLKIIDLQQNKKTAH